MILLIPFSTCTPRIPMNVSDIFIFFSIPVFSRYHPVIPKRYTQAFKLDMKNRNLIVEVGIMIYLPVKPYIVSRA